MYQTVADSSVEMVCDNLLSALTTDLARLSARRHLMTHPPHILIVDDHREVATGAVKYLEETGCAQLLLQMPWRWTRR